MTTTYFKAVRPDGTDFHTGTVQWAPPEGHEGEWIVRHPAATEIGDDASGYLSVATVATDCTAMSWPCRLLTVEAIGDVTIPSPSDLPSKRAGVAFRVTGELPAHEALGPQGEAAAALIDRARRLTADELDSLAAARDAAWDAARALVVRDLITTDQYDTLTRTWREVIGPIHPDDPDMRGDTP